MKKAIIFVIILSLCLTACGPAPSVTFEPESEVISAVPSQNCWLCGDGSEDLAYWGQDNIGIVSLNTFEVFPIIINRYDDAGKLIMQNTNRTENEMFQNRGFYAWKLEYPDRGYASARVAFYQDEVLDAAKTASFLCKDCLETLLSEIHKGGVGLGIIHFQAKEIRALETTVSGFMLGEYYIHCVWKGRNRRTNQLEAELVTVYCPPRWE